VSIAQRRISCGSLVSNPALIVFCVSALRGSADGDPMAVMMIVS
jgi:hypothetical protein